MAWRRATFSPFGVERLGIFPGAAEFQARAGAEIALRPLSGPDHPVGFASGIGVVADRAGRRVGRMGGNIGASGRAVGIAPAVILAFQFAAVVDADGQADTAMQAAVLPHVDVAVVGAPDRERAAQELRLEDMAWRQVGA